MNREIKFRGRKTSTGEWLKGSLIINKNGNHTICQISYNPVHKGVIQGWCFGVDPDTVGQFTGEQDRNDVDIYERDLFVLGADPDVYEVRFEHGCFMAFQGDKQIGLIGELKMIFLKVIGNIHEHKHLLK